MWAADTTNNWISKMVSTILLGYGFDFENASHRVENTDILYLLMT